MIKNKYQKSFKFLNFSITKAEEFLNCSKIKLIDLESEIRNTNTKNNLLLYENKNMQVKIIDLENIHSKMIENSSKNKM